MLPDDTRIVGNEIEKRIFNGSFETGGGAEREVKKVFSGKSFSREYSKATVS